MTDRPFFLTTRNSNILLVKGLKIFTAGSSNIPLDTARLRLSTQRHKKAYEFPARTRIKSLSDISVNSTAVCSKPGILMFGLYLIFIIISPCRVRVCLCR